MKLYRNLSEAVIEALRQIFIENRYADKVIEKILKQNPKWGARDRRFIAETTYDIVRWHRLFFELVESQGEEFWKLLGAWCLWNKVGLPPWPEFGELREKNFFSRYEEKMSILKIRESIPDWLDELGQRELGPAWEKEIHALNEQAKVVLRVNTLKISAELLVTRLKEDGIASKSDERFPDALILEQRQNIFMSQSFKDGLFEVQDAGSQLIAPFLQPAPGMRVIDACAGGGGKTLHLASLLKDKGRIIAMDTEEWKLEELKKRARRAGASNIVETRVIESSKTIKRLENSADRLLLDVPCSGLGVLRRNPDAKWKLSLDFIERVKELQKNILQDYSTMVKRGGIVVYSTCSILPTENEEQVNHFLSGNGEFKLEDQLTFSPSEGFDGFYMARIKRN